MNGQPHLPSLILSRLQRYLDLPDLRLQTLHILLFEVADICQATCLLFIVSYELCLLLVRRGMIYAIENSTHPEAYRP